MKKELEKKIAAFVDKEVGRGTTAAKIHLIETAVGLQIRGGYRDFLVRFGWARFAHEEVLGSGEPPRYCVAAVAQREREDAEPALPRILLPLMADGAGNHYCLDLAPRGHGEPPVVFWDHELAAISLEARGFEEWLSQRLDRLRDRRRIAIDTSL
jgi:hypothetical protein